MKAIWDQRRDGLVATSRNRRWLILWLAVLLSFAVPWVSPSIAQTPTCTDPGGCWAAAVPMPTARYGLAAAAVDGVIYAIGGQGPPDLDVVEAYNPATDTWAAKAPMLAPRTHLSATALSGIIYAIGGIQAGSVVNTVEAYDPTTNTWTAKAPMPTALYLPAVAAVNGIVYAIGGANVSSVAVSTVEAYDPTTNTWTARAPMPTPRSNAAAAVLDGIIYVMGGQTGANLTTFVNTVEAYDPATDTWATKAPMPTARSSMGAAAVNGIIYAIGGALNQFAGGSVSTVEAYDPTTDSWTAKAPMPTPRAGLVADVVNCTAYAIGGIGVANHTLTTVEAYTPATDVVFCVAIDIKPGSFPNSINPRGKGTIPVAILTTDTFDATTVDETTVLFGATGTEAAPVHAALEDVDLDGDTDMILHFNTQDTGIQCGDTTASLTGETFGGQMIEGSDSIKTAGCK